MNQIKKYSMSKINNLKLGQKIQICTDDGLYEGVLSKRTDDMLTIESVYDVDKDRFTSGFRNYFLHEVQQVRVIVQDESDDDDEEHDNLTALPNVSKSSGSVSSSSNGRSNSVQNKTICIESNAELQNIQKDLETLEHVYLTDYISSTTTLNRVIKNVRHIGVQFYGDLTERHGKITIVCLNIDSCTYIFDLVKICDTDSNGQRKIMEQLEPIFNSNKIVKVMYDCRFASDILMHRYNIQLKRVFDLQAAFATVFRDLHGVYPLSIPMNVQKILEIHEFTFNKLTLDSAIFDNVNYYERPLLQKLRYLAVIETHYLLELYDIYTEKLMERFELACEMNLNLVRGCKHEEKLEKLYQNKHTFANEFEHIRITPLNLNLSVSQVSLMKSSSSFSGGPQTYNNRQPVQNQNKYQNGNGNNHSGQHQNGQNQNGQLSRHYYQKQQQQQQQRQHQNHNYNNKIPKSASFGSEPISSLSKASVTCDYDYEDDNYLLNHIKRNSGISSNDSNSTRNVPEFEQQNSRRGSIVANIKPAGCLPASHFAQKF